MYRTANWKGVAAIAVVGLGATALLLNLPRFDGGVNIDLRSAEAKAVTRLRTEAQGSYSAGRFEEAAQELSEIVEQHRGSDDPDTQDQLAAAGMTMGYIAADQGDFAKAREVFLGVEREYRGSGVEHPEFGALDDQAAYQAIVCLQAEGKTEQCTAEYEEFLTTRTDSPLIFAVHKRLKALAPSDAARYDELLQGAVTEREKHLRLKLAMCGPRAVLHVLKIYGADTRTEAQIAELCKTTEDGTTMAAMANALRTLEFKATGMALNREDFFGQRAPFIWLTDSHYVVVTGRYDDVVYTYDPMLNGPRNVTVREDSESSFTANVLTVSRIHEEKSK